MWVWPVSGPGLGSAGFLPFRCPFCDWRHSTKVPDRYATATYWERVVALLVCISRLHFIHFTITLTVVIGSKQDLSSVFDALANEHRRELIRYLAIQPRSISELASLRSLSLPAIHKHIRVRRKVGRTNILTLERAPLRLLQTWVEQFHPYWGTDAESLETYATYLNKTRETEESS